MARLSFGMVMDHPFIDGNKRIAASVLYLGLNANEVHF
ncbi:MAG: Fic family protein [Mollicutes bacterium]|nr:Fic family protein [Mollicutes bacterium]